MDLFPTLCDLAEIDIPDYMQGQSMVPLMNQPEQKWKSAAFSQFHRRPKVSADGQRYMGYSMNTEKYHYIEWYRWDHKAGIRGEYKGAELYDRLNDSYEYKNIANKDELNSIQSELSEQLAIGWHEAKSNLN